MRYFFFLVLMAFGLALMAQQTVYLNPQNNFNPSFQLNKNVDTEISFSINVNSYTLNPVNTQKGLQYTVQSGNSIAMLVNGAPDLPKFTKSVIIPNTGSVNVSCKGTSYIEINNINIAPSKGTLSRNINPDSVKYQWGIQYASNEFYPQNMVEASEPYIFRNHRGVGISVYPFQYNPVTKTLRIYTELEVTLTPNNFPGKNELISSAYSSAEFETLYQNHFLNVSKSSKKYASLSDNGKLLIICPTKYIENMKPFLNWKKQKGQSVEMVSTSVTGVSSQSIDEYITNYYNTKGLTFVLLVGDSDKIPTLFKQGDSDAAYGHISGDDSYAEVIVGRFSFETVEELNAMVNRTIYYERDVNASATWLQNATCLASAEGAGIGDNGESDIQHMNNIAKTLQNYGLTTIDKLYDPGVKSADFSESVNRGKSLINYAGHGSTGAISTSGFSVSSITKLNNVGMYPVMFDVACLNGDFDGSTCLAEALTRAYNASGPTGVVAMNGSSILQDWASPMCGQDEMVRLFTEYDTTNMKHSFGGVSINGCILMNDNYGASGYKTTNTWGIFGDPSVTLRTRVPENIQASYSKILIKGTQTFTVNYPNNHATATLMFGDSLLAVAQFNNGKANLQIPVIDSLDKLVLTIFAPNKVTLIDTIEVVVPVGPYVNFEAFAINDHASNQNAVAEYGETLNLDLSLKNLGIEVATDIKISLSTNSPYITLDPNCSNVVLGSLSVNDSVTTNGFFTVNISRSIPNNTVVEFECTTTCLNSNDTLTTLFKIEVKAPVLQILPFEFTELEGNINQRLDAGDVVKFSVSVINSSSADAVNNTSQIVISSPYVGIDTPRIEFGNVKGNDTSYLEFIAHIHPSCPNNMTVNVEFEVESGQVYQSSQSFVVGQLPELVMGDSNLQVIKYPFYNLYGANRTQVLFTPKELGFGEKNISSISLYLARVPANSQHRLLSNFKIKVQHVSDTALASSFVSTANATTVFESASFEMPSATGAVEFPTQNFNYNGSDNLLIEFTWGQNSYFASTDYFKTSASEAGYKAVAYGYQDKVTTAGYIGTSSVRPNITFKMAVEMLPELEVNFEVINSNYNQTYPNASLKIGSLELITNSLGKSQTTLTTGDYKVWVDAKNGMAGEFSVNISESGQIIPLNLALVGLPVVSKSDIKLYPNPAQNSLQVSTPFDEYTIVFTNIAGQTMGIYNAQSKSNNLNIAHLPKGIYIVTVKNISFSNHYKLMIE